MKHLPDRIVYQLVVPEVLHPGIHQTFHNARSMATGMGSLWPNHLLLTPLKWVSMDIKEHGPSIPVRCALSIIDQHSQYLQTILLRKICCRFPQSLSGPSGNPLRLHKVIQTDNGVQFIFYLFQELTNIMDARNHYTIPYNPHRMVKSALTALVNDRPGYIPELRIQINSANQWTAGEQAL